MAETEREMGEKAPLELQSRITILHYLNILSIDIMMLVSSEAIYIRGSLDVSTLTRSISNVEGWSERSELKIRNRLLLLRYLFSSLLSLVFLSHPSVIPSGLDHSYHQVLSYLEDPAGQSS